MLVSPLVALQMITVLIESVFFWVRSDTVGLGEGGAKPQGWFFSFSEGEEQTRGCVLLFKGTDLCAQPDCAKCSKSAFEYKSALIPNHTWHHESGKGLLCFK